MVPIKKLTILPLLLAAGFAFYIYTRTDQFTISRSIEIKADQDSLFVQVNNLHHWKFWSPWMELDPGVSLEFAGPVQGAGAILKWRSDHREVGAGRMEITESIPNQRIHISLDFIEPFASHSEAAFIFEAKEENTIVSWSMSGRKNFIATLVGFFIDCDKILGSKFDEGLKNLKYVVEPKSAHIEIRNRVSP